MIVRLSILVKGLILIAVPLFFQLFFLGVMVKFRFDGASAQTWTIHSKDVIAQIQKTRVLLLSTHGAIQGYFITRDPTFEPELGRLTAQVLTELGVLRNLVADNPDQIKNLNELQTGCSSFLDFMEEGKVLIDQGRMDPETGRIRRQQSRETLSNLEVKFDQCLRTEYQLDWIRQEQLSDSWSRLDKFLVVVGLISVLGSIILSVIFSKNISSRIAGLTENTRRLAAGKTLQAQIQGDDEISRLDHVFHEMALTLDEANRRERVHAEELQQRAEELAELNAQLREKASENEMFVYSVSHDLRSPLVNLQGFSKELGLIGVDLSRLIDQETVPEQVRRRGLSLVEVEMGESIGFIQTAVSRLSGIIDALLRLSRAGRIEYRFQAVALDSVIHRVVTALRGTIEQQGAEVIVGPLPTVWGDPTAVEQIFANLIGNALNYLDPKRPGRIVIEASEPVGRSESLPGDDFPVVSVTDNGLGIAELHKSKVFTAFQRLHGDIAPGEGIGLTLVRRMVERHGGRIWFDSEQGRGTTFHVALPPPEALETSVENPLTTTDSLEPAGRSL